MLPLYTYCSSRRTPITPYRVQQSTAGVIRIALADNHTLFRAGLRKLLAGESDFEVVAECSGGPEIVNLVERYAPDVLLADLDMPGVRGLEVLQALQSTSLSTRVLVLTANENKDDLAQAMQIGASGVVLKSTDTQMLLQAIRKVATGDMWLDGRVTANVIRHLAEPRSKALDADELCGLTPREREIAALVGQGYKYRDIAQMLSISEQTVKNHLRNMFHKLGISDRLQLALFAIHHNL
jgi:DNA-binding NarL/FixJ family response regulator